MKCNVKKLAAIGISVLIGALTLSACGGKDSSGDSNETGGEQSTSGEDAAISGDEVVIGTANGSLCLAPLHIAIDNGYFEEEFAKEGIAWRTEEIDMNNIGDLVASEKIDASTQLAGAMIPQIDSGLEIAFTGGIHTGCTRVYVKKDSAIGSLADLKGKKIGVPGIGDSSVIALKRALYDLGIGVTTDNLEVEWVVYALTDLPLALENGAVDAAALHDPVAYNAEEEYGFKTILDLSTDDKFKDEYCCMTFVTNKLATENPRAAAAYTRAVLKAAAFVQADPKAAAKLQIDNGQCSGDLETNAKILSTYNYNPSVSVAEKTIHDAANELIRIGEVKSFGDVDEFTKRAFVTFDDVPDSYKYNDDGTFTEVN